MTENQKAYVWFLRILMFTAIVGVSIAIIGSTYGEPTIVEYSPFHPK